MTEIIKLIHELDSELNACKEEVRRLTSEPVIDTFKVIELCNRMNNIMAVFNTPLSSTTGVGF